MQNTFGSKNRFSLQPNKPIQYNAPLPKRNTNITKNSFNLINFTTDLPNHTQDTSYSTHPLKASTFSSTTTVIHGNKDNAETLLTVGVDR